MASPLLAVSDLQAWYGESHVLHGMSFKVNAGEVVTLLGRNGAGKTTTLKCIMGMVAKPALRSVRRSAASSQALMWRKISSCRRRSSPAV